jgi:mRNA interferase RelE/StbE
LAWTIEYEQAALDQLRKLDRRVQRRIVDYMDERVALANNPRSQGHALTGRFSSLWRYRVGDYRVICRIEDERLVVLVVGIGHRRDIYR